MLILSITVVGLFSSDRLRRSVSEDRSADDHDYGRQSGRVAAGDRTEITDKVEGAVNTISGIDELRSTSVEGVSQSFVSFVLEKNADVAASEVRNKVDLIVNDLPETAEVPIVKSSIPTRRPFCA